jgi:WD40 repeat protein
MIGVSQFRLHVAGDRHLALAGVLAMAILCHADQLPAGARARLGSSQNLLPEELYYTDLSPDGRQLVYIEGFNTLRFWDLAKARVANSLRFAPGYETVGTQSRVLFSPNGRRLATVDNKDVVVWDLVTGKRIAAVSVARVSRECGWAEIAFSADGKRLAVCRGREKDQLRYTVWDVDANKPALELALPVTDWAYLALSPDGKLLATWEHLNDSRPVTRPEDDRNLRIIVWEVDSGKQVHKFQVVGASSGHKVCFSPDGKTAAVVGTRIELWDTTTWTKSREVSGNRGYWPNGDGVAFSPDGKLLAILLGDGTVDLRDAGTGDPVARVKGHAQARTFRFIESGRRQSHSPPMVDCWRPAAMTRPSCSGTSACRPSLWSCARSLPNDCGTDFRKRTRRNRGR